MRYQKSDGIEVSKSCKGRVLHAAEGSVHSWWKVVKSGDFGPRLKIRELHFDSATTLESKTAKLDTAEEFTREKGNRCEVQRQLDRAKVVFHAWIFSTTKYAYREQLSTPNCRQPKDATSNSSEFEEMSWIQSYVTKQPKLSLFGPLALATLVGSIQIIDQTNLIPLYPILPIIRPNCAETRDQP